MSDDLYHPLYDSYEWGSPCWELNLAIHNNTSPFHMDDVDAILAVYEGERGGAPWRWVLRLNDGNFAFARGGCVGTGWSCHSHFSARIAASASAAAVLELESKDPSFIALAEIGRQLAEGREIIRRDQVLQATT